MTEKKKAVVDATEIGEFLKKTGFVFEMRMNELLTKLGYKCEISSTFLDLETGIEREIDLIASKLLKNNVTIHFLIECKQSAMDKWIFLLQKKSPRYYGAVKCLPHVPFEVMKKADMFDKLHIYHPKIPLAHNYICYSHATEKKGDQTQIEECINKLPKALADFASRVGEGRHLFFPVGLFSGQIFSVSYDGDLIVKEQPFLEYALEFKKEPYMRSFDDHFTFHTPLADLGKLHTAGDSKRIKDVSSDLGRLYQIDFVAESGVNDYIAMVERLASQVPIDEWKLPDATGAEKK